MALIEASVRRAQATQVRRQRQRQLHSQSQLTPKRHQRQSLLPTAVGEITVSPQAVGLLLAAVRPWVSLEQMQMLAQHGGLLEATFLQRSRARCIIMGKGMWARVASGIGMGVRRVRHGHGRASRQAWAWACRVTHNTALTWLILPPSARHTKGGSDGGS